MADANEQLALTDSPWFWALAFSLMALLALAAVGFSGKYQKRQAKIELQYQARERVAEKLTAENNPTGGERTDDSDPGVLSRRRATISSPFGHSPFC